MSSCEVDEKLNNTETGKNVIYLDVPKDKITFDFKNNMIAVTNLDVKNSSTNTKEDFKYIILHTQNEHGLSKYCSSEEIKYKSIESGGEAEAKKESEL